MAAGFNRLLTLVNCKARVMATQSCGSFKAMDGLTVRLAGRRDADFGVVKT